VKDLRTKTMIFCCNSSRDLYTMPPPTKANKVFAFLSTVVTTEVWHYLLGHPGRDATTALQRMPTIPPDKLSRNLCHACQIGKQVRLPFSTSTSVTTSAFDLIHCDLWTSPVMSTSGYQYYMVIVDDFSHYFWCFPLVIKSDAFATIQFFLLMSTLSFTRLFVLSKLTMAKSLSITPQPHSLIALASNCAFRAHTPHLKTVRLNVQVVRLSPLNPAISFSLDRNYGGLPF
jgi:hypothetical protein